MVSRFIIIFLILSFSKLFAQDNYLPNPPRDYNKTPATNSIFIEVGGNAGLYSVNFEKIYYLKEKFKSSIRFGFAPHFNGFHLEQDYVIENNFILLKNPHHLELGLGATLQRRYNERPNEIDNYFWENILFSVWRCGYRYQKQEDSFLFRIGLTPVVMSKDAEGLHTNYFQLWAGVSVGISF